MVLALRTGIAPSAWLAEDDRVIATAWAVLDEQDAARQQHDDEDQAAGDGPQYSG